jgi:hypothetical protein
MLFASIRWGLVPTTACSIERDSREGLGASCQRYLVRLYLYMITLLLFIKKKLCGFGPLAYYADRATSACLRNSANFCG